jgi:hypothetical protein
MMSRNLLAVGLTVGCFFLLRCSVAKKDQRALERVQAKRPLVDAMLPVVRDLYPCVTDTVAIIIPGGVDSVFYPVPVIDSVYLRDAEKADIRERFFRKGYIEGRLSISKEKYARQLPDTILKTVIDRSGVTAMERQIAYLNGQLSEREERLAELKGERRGKEWWLYGLIALLILTNAVWAVIRFK